ncbi:hypothetical protein [Burkholderia sp. WAC0059]|uniref:hypothetical protein n=1 Tax=Burkholderia sp. WAC0059 TaxID=2066022 RepID=UPI0011AF79A1|nr:hypothetical protein [Burkholderia sp. WAC0059]
MAHKEADASALLEFFLGRFDLKKATNAELSFLATASEQASHAASRLGELVRGLGGLIDDDQNRNSGASLPSNEVSGLLRSIAGELETIAQMAFIGSETSFVLGERRNGMLHEGESHA